MKNPVDNRIFSLIIISTVIFLAFIPQPIFFKNQININMHPKVATKYEWNNTIVNYGDDEGRDLVFDSNGNIIITGTIYNNSKNAYDIAVIKYNNTGEIKWNRTWGGASDDKAFSIDVDQSDNIYIAGWTTSYGNGSHDICVLKYSSSGILEWNETWGGNETDRAYGIAVDHMNNTYIAGFTKINQDIGDVIVLKYNNSGKLEWNKTWGEFDVDLAYDLILDELGNIYVTGYTDNYGAINRDIFLIKYNSTGHLKYNKTWGDARSSEGFSLIKGAQDCVYLVGNVLNLGAGGSDIWLFKINTTTGESIWNTIWGGNDHDYGYSIAIDSTENIYLAGSTESIVGSNKKASIIKFNKFGNFLWYKTYSDDDDEEVGYGIGVDTSQNLYFTGKTKINETGYDIFTLKDLPLPGDFELSHNATSPDQDGTFNLTWTESLDANNYTVYQSNKTINVINESVVEVVSGNTNRTCLIKGLEDGIYYYKIFAYNEFGNTSSTELMVIVQFPPGDFELFDDFQDIDNDGFVNLSWVNSSNADNYSIYVQNSFISEINGSSILIAEGLTNNSHVVAENLGDGDYYYVVVAYNEAGQTLSNCINISVRRIPCIFNLSKEIDSQTIDIDGIFHLSWTHSEYAEYYVIYYSLENITEINGAVQELDTYIPEFEWPRYRYQISISENGTYFFMVVAFNDNGNFSSVCIQVEIRIPPTPGNGNIPLDPLIIFSIILIIGIACVLIYLIYRYKNQIYSIIKKKLEKTERS